MGVASTRQIPADAQTSAWLHRYIDPEAEFIYVDDPADRPTDATPFDMVEVGCEHTRIGSDVTFETILRRHDLTDPVLWRLAQIVHQADVEDDLYDAPEASGLDTVIRALGNDHDDESVRVITATIFDKFRNHLRRETLET